MLSKSTGSLRRKRAENSPVWRKGSRGGGIRERSGWQHARGGWGGKNSTRSHSGVSATLELVSSVTQARLLLSVSIVGVFLFFFNFFLPQRDNLESRRAPSVRTNAPRRATGSPRLFSLDADTQSPPPTFLRVSRKPRVTRRCGSVGR